MRKIIILHGWTYNLDKWVGFENLLKQNNFNVRILKVPGLTSPNENVWKMKDYVDWLKNELKKEKTKVILLGHSNGGRISISFASKYPNNISNLILVNSAGIFQNDIKIRLKRAIFKTITKIGKKLSVSKKLRKMLYKVAGEHDYEKANTTMKKTMTNLISIDLRPELKKIKIPTLIIWGKNDKTTPLSNGKLMNDLIEKSVLKVIENTGHSPFYTHPEKVIELIIQEIKKNDNI